MKPLFLRSYYGGRSLPDVARVVRELASGGMKACVSALPRLRLLHAGIVSEKSKYLGILPALEGQGLSADLTVKLSQLGERWVYRDCVESLEEIAVHCRERGSFLWVDMEQSTLVDRTLEAFETVAARHDNVGLCLQTYLKRTERDLEHLLRKGYPVRLVKGYYRERPPAAFRTWEEVTQSFERLLAPLIAKSRRPAIGTHDPRLIERAKAAEVDHKLEFQFFLGARPELASGLAREGRKVRIYIPYGALLPYLLHSLPFMDLWRNLQRVLGLYPVR